MEHSRRTPAGLETTRLDLALRELPKLHDRICKFDGCVHPIRAQGRAQGFCPSHYQEHLKALASGPQKNISRKGPCLVEGCDGARRSRGLCAAHYDHSLRRTTTCPSCGVAMTIQAALCSACHKAAVAAQMPAEKTCRRCERVLPIDCFGLRRERQGAAKWRSRCRECEAAEQHIKAKNDQRHRPKAVATASYTNLRRYARKLGIAWAEVVERYPVDNRCQVCGRTPQEASKSGRFARLSLDHCHQTGQLRGFLCSPCNSGVGHLGDNPVRLRAALKYLAKAENRVRLEHGSVGQDQIPGLWED